MKQQNEYVGRQVFKLYPKIAELILVQSRAKKILSNYEDMALVKSIFSEYYDVDFPGNLSGISSKNVTYMRIKFTAVCLHCFDPESINGQYDKRVRYNLRKTIADSVSINRTQVSQYIAKARVYNRAYPDFEIEVMQIVSAIKSKIGFEQLKPEPVTYS